MVCVVSGIYSIMDCIKPNCLTCYCPKSEGTKPKHSTFNLVD